MTTSSAAAEGKIELPHWRNLSDFVSYSCGVGNAFFFQLKANFSWIGSHECGNSAHRPFPRFSTPTQYSVNASAGVDICKSERHRYLAASGRRTFFRERNCVTSQPRLAIHYHFLSRSHPAKVRSINVSSG
jgi:hypothetical protein